MTSSQPGLHGRRVLVVEDDYYLASDSCDWLQQAGATVVGPVGNAEQVRALLTEQSIDAAMIDINLGGGPTFDVAASLCSQGIPFVFTTGYDQATIPPEYSRVPRLEKPFSGRDLVAALASVA